MSGHHRASGEKKNHGTKKRTRGPGAHCTRQPAPRHAAAQRLAADARAVPPGGRTTAGGAARAVEAQVADERRRHEETQAELKEARAAARAGGMLPAAEEMVGQSKQAQERLREELDAANAEAARSAPRRRACGTTCSG